MTEQELSHMHSMLIATLVAASLQSNAAPESHVFKAKSGTTQFWQFACNGSGQPQIRGRLQSFDPATGEIVWLIKDKDSLSATASAVISGDKITMFGDTGRINKDRTKLQIDTAECPGGFSGWVSR